MLLPIGKSGPLEIRTAIRALTPFELPTIQRRIEEGMKVSSSWPLRALHEPKSAILRAILQMEKPAITHLVVDSRTAFGVFRRR